MVQQTSKGIPYPESSDNAQIWTWIQNLAVAVDGLLVASATQTVLATALGHWTSFSPSWNTSTGSATPAFGNAVVDCKYIQIGKTVVGYFDVTFGSGTNFGGGGTSDNWQFGLPVPSVSISAPIGMMELTNSNSVRSVGRAHMVSTTQFALEISSGRPDGTTIANAGTVDAVSPWTWANNHWIRGPFHYEAA
jgi:hypothetical protein